MKLITFFFCSFLFSAFLTADETPKKAPIAPPGAAAQPKASPSLPTPAQKIPEVGLKPSAKTTPPPKPVPSTQKAPPIASKATAAALSQLADDVQKQYNKTNSATFDFEQSYKSLFLPTLESSKGQVFFKARNMLWRYNEPSDRKKEFYIEGRKFTYHLVNDKQAFTHNCFEKDTLSAAITFLWGHGNLKNSFEIRAFQGAISDPKLKWLTLIPKEKNAPVKSISLGVDPKTAIVVESVVTDLNDGVNSFRFTNFKVNPTIPEKTFQFVPKSGVKLQPMANVVCPQEAPPAPIKATPPSKAPAKSPSKP